MKNKTCRLCTASFVPETKTQEYCNICLKMRTSLIKTQMKGGNK